MAKSSGGTRTKGSGGYQRYGSYAPIEDRLGSVKDSDVLGSYYFTPSGKSTNVREFFEGEDDDYKQNLTRLSNYESYAEGADAIVKNVNAAKGASNLRATLPDGVLMTGKIEKLISQKGYGVRDLAVDGRGAVGGPVAFKTLSAAKSYAKHALVKNYYEEKEYQKRR